MKLNLSSAVILVSSVLIGNALAAEADMSKLTCKEVGSMSAARKIGAVMWISGYLHGKQNNPVIDGEKAHANAVKTVSYCKTNGTASVADAINSLGK